MRWLSAFLLLLVASANSAQAASPDPFAKTVQWSAVESWSKNKAELVYTFRPDGTFTSSDWAEGKGQGTWSRDGDQLVLIWPKYDHAFWRGTINGAEVRGTAYGGDGKKKGSFVLHLMH